MKEGPFGVRRVSPSPENIGTMDALVIRTPRMASSLNAIASIILSENASCVLALRHSSERGDMELSLVGGRYTQAGRGQADTNRPFLQILNRAF